jgi:hypothetical protein
MCFQSLFFFFFSFVVLLCEFLLSSEASFFVKLRGLPFSATDAEIGEFFAPLVLSLVHHVFTPGGKRAGDAFVEFASGTRLLFVVCLCFASLVSCPGRAWLTLSWFVSS